MEGLNAINGVPQVASITLICLGIGFALKNSRFKDFLIPLVMMCCGAGLGIAGYFSIPDFADNILMAIAIGISSGLSSTGFHQLFKQLKNDEGDDTTSSGDDETIE